MRRGRGALAVGLVVASLGASPVRASALFTVASYRAASGSETFARAVYARTTTKQRTVNGTDRPDAVKGYQTHAIYLVPRDRQDEHLDARGGLIPRALDGTRAWFQANMGKAPRFDRTRTRAHDITFIRGARKAIAYDFASIVGEVRAGGFDAANKRYAIFASVSQGGTCGESQFPLTPNVSLGRFLVVWLDSTQACGARDPGRGTVKTAGRTDTILAHEWLHTEGAVPMLAPRHCPGHAYHACTAALWTFPAMDPELADVMFPYAGMPLRDKILDRGRDDYLDHGLPHVRDVRDSVYLA